MTTLQAYRKAMYAKREDPWDTDAVLTGQWMTVPYAYYKSYARQNKVWRDSYDAKTKTIMIYMQESDMDLYKDWIAGSQDDEESRRIMAGKGYEIVEMSYSEYKLEHAGARCISNSYNPVTKTIRLWMRKDDDK